jgi:hypothetical protein
VLGLFYILVGIAALAGSSPLNAAQTRPERGIIICVAHDGSDHWSGRVAAANAERTDGRLRSLLAAPETIRRTRAAGQRGVVTIRLRGGTTFPDAPRVIEPVDSGTAETPVVFERYENEPPVLRGGRSITGFRRNGPLGAATLPEAKAGSWYFHQLFVDGQRRQRARSPNRGYHRIARTLPGPADAQGGAVARDRFVSSPGDPKPWARLGAATPSPTAIGKAD